MDGDTVFKLENVVVTMASSCEGLLRFEDNSRDKKIILELFSRLLELAAIVLMILI